MLLFSLRCPDLTFVRQVTLGSLTSVGQLSFFSPAECICLYLVQNGIGLIGEAAAESPQDDYTLSVRLPGKQSLVHFSAWNQAERETVALVFSVAGSWIGLFSMEGSCELAKGQLVLHAALTPSCLLASFGYLVSDTGRMTASTRGGAVGKARQKGQEAQHRPWVNCFWC